MNEDVTVILNGYRRPHVFKEQYEAMMAQTIKPQVFFWQNKSPEHDQFDKSVIDSCTSFIGNDNLGVWGRFTYALNAKTKYVCVFDDDTVPGPRWLENCIESNKIKRGLYGTIGVVFHSENGYDGPYHRVGWDRPNEQITEVDIVGHSWFFEKELLTYFWRELPDPKFLTAGEDTHFSHMLQKYSDLKTYVAPHPPSDRTLWGSIPEKAGKYGTEHVGIYSTHGHIHFQEFIKNCRNGGFKFLFEK